MIYCSVVFAIEENLQRGVSVGKMDGGNKVGITVGGSFNTSRTGLLNCLNARSRGLNFRHRASCI